MSMTIDDVKFQLDSAMRWTGGVVLTTVGRLCDVYGLTPGEIGQALSEMAEERIEYNDGTTCFAYDIRVPPDSSSSRADQEVALRMGGWYFDEVS